MTTYAKTQALIKQCHGFVPKTCWIAHVLDEHGCTKRVAANRINSTSRKYPCPDDKRQAVETALRHFKMI